MQQLPSKTGSSSGMTKSSEDTSRKNELIAKILHRFALPSVYNRQITDEDLELWEGLLKGYSVDEVAYAFDCWGRNEIVWPPPAGIITIANAYRATNQEAERRDLPSGRSKLSDSWPVWLVMFNLISTRVENFQKAKRKYEPLNSEEIDLMLAEAREIVEKKKVELKRRVI